MGHPQQARRIRDCRSIENALVADGPGQSVPPLQKLGVDAVQNGVVLRLRERKGATADHPITRRPLSLSDLAGNQVLPRP